MILDLRRTRDTHLADLVTAATRERAQACAELTDARGTIRILEADLCQARLDLALARELLAYHGLTPIEAAPDE